MSDCISGTHWPPVASAWRTGRRRHGASPSLQKVLVDAVLSTNLVWDMSFNFTSTNTQGLLLGAHTDAMIQPHNRTRT